MKYAICNKEKALAVGIRELGHRTKDTEILLNEREIIINPNLTGTLEERVAALDGTAYSRTGVYQYINQNNWK